MEENIPQELIKMTKPYQHRLMIPVTKEQHNELNRLIPYGEKAAIFSQIVQDLIDRLQDETERARLLVSYRLNKPLHVIREADIDG